MASLIFFDDRGGALSPVDDLRLSFNIRVAALTNLERLASVIEHDGLGLWTPDALAPLARDRHDVPINLLPEGEGPVLAVNGRCPIPVPQIEALGPGQALIEAVSGDVVAARLSSGACGAMLRGEAFDAERIEFPERVLLAKPWHVRSARDLALNIDLTILGAGPTQDLPGGVMLVGEHPAHIDPGATVYPGVTLVAEDGPVHIGTGATVRPGAIIIGPAAIGAGSTVLERALIRAHTAIGPVCKVSGEISGVVFQGFSNKAHEGFLGDSWVGEWVNLGADTNNSNLLNTYGDVTVQTSPGGSRERTGEQFLGAIIGDHVKTAIGTRLMTGCVLGTGAMLAQTQAVSGCVPAFSWNTDKGRQAFRLAKFLEVMRAMMGRREIEPSEAYLERIAAVHGRAGET
ncbi:MAG: hypothetical protein H6811_11290 [Phycisphaeraceae bacterium]|nr:hypothetical protein [Phycisphaeraceae bacterium]